MEMDKKQKSLVALTVIALGFLAYQVFELVNGDLSQDSAPEIVQTSAKPLPSHDTVTTKHIASLALQKPSLSPVKQSAPAAVKKPKQALSSTQHAYLHMLNQYELAKLKRQLLQEQAAIATAQNQIVKLHHQTQTLDDGGVANDSNAVPSGMMLSYLGEQSQHWSATLNVEGHFQAVRPGMQLANGYRVLKVSQQGVLLADHNQRALLTFDGLTHLPAIASKKPEKPVKKVAAPVAKPKPKPVAKKPAPAVKPVLTAFNSKSTKLTPQLIKSMPSVQVNQQHVLHFNVARKAITKPAKQLAMAPSKPKQKFTQLADNTYGHFAKETQDMMQPDELAAFGVHLDPIEIHPTVSDPFSSATYVAKPQAIPQDYHLENSNNSNNENIGTRSFSQEKPDHTKLKRLKVHAPVILNMPAHQYTLQLIGSYQRNKVDTFIHSNHLQGKVQVLSIKTPSHRHWHMVIYGHYLTANAAETAMVQMPSRMRLNGPWVRRIGDVQRSVKRQA